MTLIAAPDRAVPLTDGEIAAVNLESARLAVWARFARDPRFPGAASWRSVAPTSGAGT
jgi:hypothetical protein